MIGPLFTISAVNVARAAVRQAEARIPVEDLVEITVGSHDPGPVAEMYVLVTSPAGRQPEILVDDGAVRDCLDSEDAQTAQAETQQLVDRLAAEILTTVEAARVQDSGSPHGDSAWRTTPRLGKGGTVEGMGRWADERVEAKQESMDPTLVLTGRQELHRGWSLPAGWVGIVNDLHSDLLGEYEVLDVS